MDMRMVSNLKNVVIALVIVIQIGNSLNSEVTINECESPWESVNGMCILLNPGFRSWSRAQSYCRFYEGELLYINNDEEQLTIESFLQLLMPHRSNMSSFIWLDATNQYDNENWVWARNNQSLTYANWYPSSRNQLLSKINRLNCACLKLNDFYWNDCNCDKTAQFVCRKQVSTDSNIQLQRSISDSSLYAADIKLNGQFAQQASPSVNPVSIEPTSRVELSDNEVKTILSKLFLNDDELDRHNIVNEIEYNKVYHQIGTLHEFNNKKPNNYEYNEPIAYLFSTFDDEKNSNGQRHSSRDVPHKQNLSPEDEHILASIHNPSLINTPHGVVHIVRESWNVVPNDNDIQQSTSTTSIPIKSNDNENSDEATSTKQTQVTIQQSDTLNKKLDRIENDLNVIENLLINKDNDKQTDLANTESNSERINQILYDKDSNEEVKPTSKDSDLEARKLELINEQKLLEEEEKQRLNRKQQLMDDENERLLKEAQELEILRKQEEEERQQHEAQLLEEQRKIDFINEQKFLEQQEKQKLLKQKQDEEENERLLKEAQELEILRKQEEEERKHHEAKLLEEKNLEKQKLRQRHEDEQQEKRRLLDEQIEQKRILQKQQQFHSFKLAAPDSASAASICDIQIFNSVLLLIVSNFVIRFLFG